MRARAALPALCYLAIFSIPFGTRKLLLQFTPGFHEYEAAFFYATDIILASFFIFVFFHFLQQQPGGKFEIRNPKSEINSNNQNQEEKINPGRSRRVTLALCAFLLFAGASIFFAPSFGLAFYSFARLFTAAGFAAAVAYALRQKFVQLRHIFAALAASAVFQSLIAFAQFAKQGSIGLWFLGEPALSANAAGIAKFAAEGGKVLRAYGTLPHPNILGAFLVLGLISLCGVWISTNSESRTNLRISRLSFVYSQHIRYSLMSASIYIVLLGLVLTFSRSAWLTALLAVGALLVYGFFTRELRSRAVRLFVVLFAICALLFAVFSSLIFPRAQISGTEPAVAQRLEYNRLGLDLIVAKPFGVGIGSQVFYSVRSGLYERFGMNKVWEWEPIHNIYLLIAAEVGVAGLATFFVFVFALLNSKSEARNSKQYQNSNDENKKQAGFFDFGISDLFRISNLEFRISATMLIALLLLGLVDHLLWTLQPGRLMLWLAIGLVWGASTRTVRTP